MPNDGELISNYYFTPDDIFDGGTTYKRIHHINPNLPNWNPNNFWPYNSTNHTFTLDVIEVSAGAKWRQIYSLENGSLHHHGWNNLNTGVNSISITPEGDYDRSVIGFETDGSFKFRKFSHSFGSQTWGYEEILVSVPEPSTYAIILGVIALSSTFRRRNPAYS
ncbi:MAG: PEP-CTERM sorting domain-containing protein [Coraliomargaritaceae bacterium]